MQNRHVVRAAEQRETSLRGVWKLWMAVSVRVQEGWNEVLKSEAREQNVKTKKKKKAVPYLHLF